MSKGQGVCPHKLGRKVSFNLLIIQQWIPEILIATFSKILAILEKSGKSVKTETGDTPQVHRKAHLPGSK